jgi:phosphatidate phosphatase PAH1
MSAIDCVAVRQEDNSLKFSPLFIRFDKKAKETATVEVFVNGIPATNESNYRLIVKRGEKYATLELVDENERVLPESTGEDAVVAEEIAAMQSMLIPCNF